MGIQDQRPSMESKNSSAIKSYESLTVFHTYAENLINKRNELYHSITSVKPEIICITEILFKNASLPVDACDLQIHRFYCFTNNNKSLCHRGVLIYTKKCLKAVATSFSELDYREYVYCKLSSKNSGLLHILRLYSSLSNTIESNNDLNSFISELSKLNGHLLILGDFDYRNIYWSMLSTPHNKENCATKFLMVTQNCFLYQYVNNTTHVRPNQTPTLIDLIFISDNQAINNFSFLSLLGKSHHNVITFQYQLECIESIKVGYNYHKANYTAMKRKLNAIDWKELFHGKDVNLSWKTFLKLLNDIILKYTPRFTFNNKRKKSIWMNSQAFSKVQLKNRAYHQYLRTKIHNDYNIYVKYRNQVKIAFRKSVSNYEHFLSKKVKSNPKAFFAYAKGKLKYASSLPDLKDGSKIITSDEGKATILNSFLKSVFMKEKKIHHC